MGENGEQGDIDILTGPSNGGNGHITIQTGNSISNPNPVNIIAS